MKQLHLDTHSYKVLVQDFKQWLDILGYAKSTVYNLPIHLREFFHYLENKNINKLNHIQTKHITDYYNYLKSRTNQRRGGGISNGHLNKHQQALFKFREYLKSHNHKGINIHLKREIGNARDMLSVLTQAEIKELFAATKSSNPDAKIRYRDKAILVCCYSCGLRRNELIHLDVKDIFFGKQRLFVSKGKNYKERFVPLNKHSLRILEEYIYDWRTAFYKYKETEALFINYRGGRLQGMSFANRLKAVIKATENHDLQERTITLHSLRHSIATHLLEQGADIEQISTFLGHTSLESTQIYTHFLEYTGDEHVQELLRKQRLQQQNYPNLPKKRY
ncbi:tyrosine-type recombinase/integrase [Tenacibaculum sp. nBUS_03]|uniref:tyrosine-type recombinase/integrase n=1 Tax=Tenacibaculum sp. nBUS_03 TaxID=3395320 RepID=UPI003EBEE533